MIVIDCIVGIVGYYMNHKILLIKSGKFSKTFSFLIFSSLLIMGLTKGFAQDSSSLPTISTVTEYRQLQKKFHHLGSEDEQKKLIAALYLGKFAHYSEVREALLEAFLTELDHNSSNTRLMTIIMTSVSSLLSSQDAFILIQLRERLRERLNQSPMPSNTPIHFLEQVMFLVNRVLREPGSINSYTLNDMQERADHHTLRTRLYSLSFNSKDDDIRQHIRNFRRGSVQFLSDHLFFKEHYHDQVYQEEASQVINTLYQTAGVSISIRSLARSLIDVLTQTTSIPIVVGSKDINETIIRTTAQNISDTMYSYSTGRKVYVVKTTPSQINRINRDSSNSDFSKVKSLKDYLDAVLDIEERLQIRIVLFIDKFHRLSDSQMRVLRSYLQRRGSIQIIAASSREGYQSMPKGLLSFVEIRAGRMSQRELRGVITKSILPRLRRSRFNFNVSEEAIDSLIGYIYRYSYEESLISVARRLMNDLLIQRSQSIAESLDVNAYINWVEITNEEVYQFIHNLERPHEQEAVGVACGENLM